MLPQASCLVCDVGQQTADRLFMDASALRRCSEEKAPPVAWMGDATNEAGALQTIGKAAHRACAQPESAAGMPRGHAAFVDNLEENEKLK